MHYEFLELKPLLIECVIQLLLSRLVHRWLLSLLEEVWHELFVRDELQPSKSKGWVLVRVQFIEEVSQTEENEQMSLLIEALTVVDSCKDIHEHSIVRFLIEL